MQKDLTNGKKNVKIYHGYVCILLVIFGKKRIIYEAK